MKTEKSSKSRKVSFRLTYPEFEKIDKAFKASTCNKLSQFICARLLDRPIVATYRNRSLDDVMAEFILLRKELNNIGNNFNQAVHKLHMCDTIPQLRIWLKTYDQDRNNVVRHVAKIKEKINQIADQWLQG